MQTLQLDRVQDTVASILTLRYNPTSVSSLPQLSWKDFVEYDGIAGLIEPLLQNVLTRIVGNAKRVGMGISGGVDSSTVLALTRHLFPDLTIRTYCVSFGDDQRESKKAAHVASLYGTRHEDFIVENPFEKLSEQIEIVGEPRGNLYTAFLFDKVAEDGCDLLLTGDGGDELFGGYAFRYERAMQGSTFGPSDYMDAHERDWVPDQTTLIPNLDWNRIYAYLNQSLNAPLPRLGRVFLADFNGKLLHDFQPTNAAFAQHYKIRTESPFLQPELIYAASHLPYNLKYDPVNKIGKLLLRNILLLRSGFQPAVRPKIGFGMDLAWMWDHHLREICETHLKNSKLNLVGINTGWLPHGFSEADKHDLRYITKMLGLLAIQLWLEA